MLDRRGANRHDIDGGATFKEIDLGSQLAFVAIHRLFGELGEADQGCLVGRHFIDDKALGRAEMLIDPGPVSRGESNLEHGLGLLPNGPDQLQPT